jgi:hypothetical protein
MGSSVNPNLKRCPFRWQCPVSSPTTHLSWSLFNFNRSLILLAEGPDMSPLACLSPITDSQYFLWFLLVQSLTAFLATPIEMPQAGSGLVNGCSDPVLANWSAVSFPTIPSCPGTHISWTCVTVYVKYPKLQPNLHLSFILLNMTFSTSLKKMLVFSSM